MTLILRKCYKDGSSRNGFKYGKVGERVTAPDWSPRKECGNGLHGLLNGNGDWGLLEGYDWLIIDADDKIVKIDDCKCKFNTGIIKFRGSAKNLAKSNIFNQLKLNEQCAFYWALHIGNKDEIIKKIKSEELAYSWATRIGNKDVMINKIESEEWALNWALHIGNKDVMIEKIRSSEFAFRWALHIGNKDVMIKKIKSEFYAFRWALHIGNKDVMIKKIKSEEYAVYWAADIGNKDVMIKKIKSKEYTEIWKELC